MSQSPQKFHELLAIQHYAPINFPLPSEEIQCAANAFLEFLKLPDEIKRQLHFPASSHRASADGYTDKSNVNNKDPKQFFHWNPEITRHPAYLNLQGAHIEVSKFFQSAKMIYHEIEGVLHTLFKDNLIEHKNLVFNQNALIDGTLRFLCYSPRPNHDFGARAHYDKGFSTLAIGDSAPGLRIGCCDTHPLKLVLHQSGTALFMPAWMLFQASRGKIKPAWHDVVHGPGNEDISEICARWSIVFFINSPGTPFSSWDTVHRPLH